jgi:LssY-like putative type I secretion system component LssY
MALSLESTMKSSCPAIKGLALAIAMLANINVSAQSDPGVVAAPRDYSFTISTAQPWTDTGVDLETGELLGITASPHSSDGCDPRGVSGSGDASAGLPVVSASPGALIARTQAQGVPILIGSSKQVKVDAPGHLFLGVNGQATPACDGSFAVKIHVSSAGSAPAAAGNALTATSAPASAPATTTATTAQAKQDIKSKLASAAQVFMAGQFGTGASPTSSSAAPTSSNADSATSATAAAPAAPALSVSTAALDSGLRKNIDELPRRVNDQFNNQGDMVNFVLVGSQQQVQSALEAASWRVADTDNREAVLKAALETYEKKDYLQMPMSQLYLFGRKQDFGYELAQAYSVVASRHHFRIWKAPTAWNGQTLWAGAGTHDIGFEKDQRNGSMTHKIDPAVDGERDNIGQTLQQAGKVKSLSYYTPPDPVQGAKNATGGGYHSDGRILVIVLQ